MTENPHILIVDDDVRICRTLRQYLKREGYRVSIATDGKEMWDIFGKDQPAAILLDVMLPGEDGMTLARELRKISDVGIIMLTGKNHPADTIIGLENCPPEYNPPPFH